MLFDWNYIKCNDGMEPCAAIGRLDAKQKMQRLHAELRISQSHLEIPRGLNVAFSWILYILGESFVEGSLEVYTSVLRSILTALKSTVTAKNSHHRGQSPQRTVTAKKT